MILKKKKSENAAIIYLLDEDRLASFIKKLTVAQQSWITKNQFKASPGQVLLLPTSSDTKGANPIDCVLVGENKHHYESIWMISQLSTQLPEGEYYLDPDYDHEKLDLICLGWHLGAYKFLEYKNKNLINGIPSKESKKPSVLCVPDKVDLDRINALASSICYVRNLINRPANDLHPEALEREAEDLANRFEAKFTTIIGEKLLANNFPAIYEVGKGSHYQPRLIKLDWGSKKDPLVVLVGKGVTFDTGGLDIKSSSNMRLMKKDMGGAAHVLGLAKLIMQHKLKIHLCVLIPCVENSISGKSYRPSDIIMSRKNLSIEIGNTDAEGRVIMADALTYADEMKADLIIDMATLTGAARTALGTELPVLFSNRSELIKELEHIAFEEKDPFWPLPLWDGYRTELESKVADIANVGTSSYAGAIVAALFLESFITSQNRPWMHFDLMAYNVKAKPGRPEGGEAMMLRSLFRFLEKKYQSKGK